MLSPFMPLLIKGWLKGWPTLLLSQFDHTAEKEVQSTLPAHAAGGVRDSSNSSYSWSLFQLPGWGASMSGE